MECLSTQRRAYRRSPTPHNLSRLQQAEEHFQENITQAKSNYESSLINNYAFGANSVIYRYIRSLSKSKSIPSTVYLGTSAAMCDKSKAKLFNLYFHSVFNKESQPIPDYNASEQQYNSLCSFTITEADVFETLSQLDTSKAVGIDGIGPKILKHCAASLSHPLCHLFNISLSNGSVPQEWKTHIIIPIHKSNDRSLVNNYRPISLLSNISKVLERLIFNNISKFVFQSISPVQFGFIQGRSTTQQLLSFLSFIYEAISHGHQTDVVYLDFRKAFDMVQHSRLLTKLWKVGICGNLWKWFKSYLTNRKHCVRITNTLSDTLPVLSGVPQGSILGPLLFLIYVNDLPATASSSQPFLFADDTKLLKTIFQPSDILLLQKDLDSFNNWSIVNELYFGIPKCVFLSFNSKLSSSYHIDSNALSHPSEHRDLGIQMSSDLSWSSHYNMICSKAYRSLALLRRSFGSFGTIEARRSLYLALVRSQLTYCSQLWNPYLIKDILTLERVQRRATKYILNDYTSDYRLRLLKLKLLPLMYTLDYYDLLFFVKSLKQPSDHFNILNYVAFSNSRTRSATAHKLRHNYSPNNKIRNSYFNRLPRLWNALPPINTELHLTTIKSTIYNYLWSHFTEHFNPNDSCTYHFLCPCYNCCNISPTPNFS